MHYSIAESRKREHVSEFLNKASPPWEREKNKGFLLPGKGGFSPGSLYDIHKQLDGFNLPHDVNEKVLGSLVTHANLLKGESKGLYWLTLARIAELGVLVAGAYADGCEFSAVGDLLVNPLKTVVHIKGELEPWVKKRHGSLSEEMNSKGESKKDFISWFKRNARSVVVQRPLIPELCEIMEESNMISKIYIENYRRRMAKIVDVITFMWAWKVNSGEDFIGKMKKATPETRKFVESSLCNFNSALFKKIGKGIGNKGEMPYPVIDSVKV